MALQFPGSSGSYASLATALNSNGSTVFFRFKLPSLPTGEPFIISISSTNSSTKNNLGGTYTDGNVVHGLYIENVGGGTYDINEIAYWDGFLGPILSNVAAGAWVNGAIVMYEANSRPAIKFALRPDGGSLVSRVRNDSFFSGTHDTFENLRVILAAGYGGSSPSNARFLDVFMYPSAITSDGDIQTQFDSLDDEFASLYWQTLFRGYATVPAAIAKEGGSASPSGWTVDGSPTVDNSDDGGTGGEVGPTLSGGGVLGVTDSLSAPATPAGFAVTTVTATSITLTWSASSGATLYTIYGRNITAGESGWEIYQQTPSVGPFTVLDLSPRVQYGFKISASNAAGESALSSEGTGTTGNLRIRMRALPAAAGKTCDVSLHFPAVAPRIVGEYIATFESQTWEADTVIDDELGEEVAEMFIDIEPGNPIFGPGIADGDVLDAYVEKTDGTEATWMMRDVKVQVV